MNSEEAWLKEIRNPTSLASVMLKSVPREQYKRVKDFWRDGFCEGQLAAANQIKKKLFGDSSG